MPSPALSAKHETGRAILRTSLRLSPSPSGPANPASDPVAGLPYSDWLPRVSPEFDWSYPHLHLVRKHLADVTDGRCRKLILSLPPQHGKSEGLTVRYPVWRLHRNPRLRIAVGAYNQTHADRFSRKARRLAQTLFPLSQDRKAASEWETEAGGYFVAVGVGAGITGLPVDLLLIDDPVKNREEADSPAHQERVWEWYMDDLTTRLQHESPVIVVMTRWHDGDLAGRILASDDGPNWRNVVLPAFAEKDDPLKRPVGAPLCPQLHPTDDLEGKRQVLGEGFEGLYQQRPVPRGGLFFRREWFGDLADRIPDGKVERVRYWDTAASLKDTACYTAGVLLAKAAEKYWVEDVIRGRWQPAERNAVIRQTATADKALPGFRKTYFEHGAGDSGIESAQRLVGDMAGLPVEADRPTGSKEERATPFADQARVGNVRILARPWSTAYLGELTTFPRGTYKDQVDSTSGAFNKLTAPQPVFLVARQTF